MMGLTENFSPTYVSTENPFLDFVYHVVPDTLSNDLIQRLDLAWAHDPLTTLKLICNLRGVRGFYTLSLWLHKSHPKTLALNLKALANFGYFKDLPEILYRLLYGPEVHKLAKQARYEKRRAKRNIYREISKAKIALDMYNNDPDYRFLFDCVCDVFAELLKSDFEFMSRGESVTRSMRGLRRHIMRMGVRDRLRKQVLVQLHKTLELPELFMSDKQWNSLPYNRVVSVAMTKYEGLFQKHDKERFEDYLEKVKSEKVKIAAGALLPHQNIKSLYEDGEQVAELQWERMVSDVAKKGKLTNCIAVCDVLGSINGTSMEVCVALGLLVSKLSEEPWKGKLFTFSQDPQLHLIKGDTLLAKTEFIREIDWGRNTDLQKVFDQILEVAVEAKLTEEQLIKRQRNIWEGFDAEDSDPEEEMKKGWETDYEVIQRKFQEKGYNKVPEIVFWNLRDSMSTSIVANQTGVALVCGFAKNLLTLFLEEGGIVNPEDVMRLAIAGGEYKELVVYD
ncbi:hypothetical protein ACB092_02G095600 [Castanea dentata]